jgi:hypothetical protein
VVGKDKDEIVVKLDCDRLDDIQIPTGVAMQGGLLHGLRVKYLAIPERIFHSKIATALEALGHENRETTKPWNNPYTYHVRKHRLGLHVNKRAYAQNFP